MTPGHQDDSQVKTTVGSIDEKNKIRKMTKWMIIHTANEGLICEFQESLQSKLRVHSGTLFISELKGKKPLKVL